MQTSKQYHSLALWVIMLISLSLLSACGGGGGDSNLNGQTLFGDELDEDKTIPNNAGTPPAEWKKGVDYPVSFAPRTSSDDSDTTNTTTQHRNLTIAGLYQTYHDKYSGAVVTENEQQTGLGLIRDTGEALFLVDIADNDGVYEGFISGNDIVLDPSKLDYYVGDYGCAKQGCKDAIALGSVYNKDGDKKFYHDVKININVKNEGNKLIASVPAWFVSDRLNSEKFTVLKGESEEFSKDGNGEYSFTIFYNGDPSPDDDVNEKLPILIDRCRLLEGGSTDDVFIACSYAINYLTSPDEDKSEYNEYFDHFGVFALEKIAKNAN